MVAAGPAHQLWSSPARPASRARLAPGPRRRLPCPARGVACPARRETSRALPGARRRVPDLRLAHDRTVGDGELVQLCVERTILRHCHRWLATTWRVTQEATYSPARNGRPSAWRKAYRLATAGTSAWRKTYRLESGRPSAWRKAYRLATAGTSAWRKAYRLATAGTSAWRKAYRLESGRPGRVRKGGRREPAPANARSFASRPRMAASSAGSAWSQPPRWSVPWTASSRSSSDGAQLRSPVWPPRPATACAMARSTEITTSPRCGRRPGGNGNAAGTSARVPGAGRAGPPSCAG